MTNRSRPFGAAWILTVAGLLVLGIVFARSLGESQPDRTTTDPRSNELPADGSIDADLEPVRPRPLDRPEGPGPALRQEIGTSRTDDDVTIRVVDHATNRPVPGATLVTAPRLYGGQFNRADRLVYERLCRDTFALFERFGSSLETDAQGVAIVPSTLRRAGIPWPETPWFAKAPDGRRGFAKLDVSVGGQHEVRVQPVSDLVVEVRHASGAPAANVVVFHTAKSPNAWSQQGWSAVTDGAGVAVLRAIQLQVWCADQQSTIGVGMLGLTVKPVPIDVTVPPDEPIRLTLPPCGRVDVRVHAIDGITEKAYCEVRLSTEESSGSTRLDDGVASFQAVGLNQTLRAELRIDDRAIQDLEFEGPTEADQLLVVELTAPTLSIVRARVLDSELQPIRERRISVQRSPSVQGVNRRGGVGATTDRDGCLLAIVAGDPCDTLQLTSRHEKSTGLFSDPVPIGRALRVEEPLGDIVLHEDTAWIQGRVVDELGNPTSFNRVALETPDDDAARTDSYVRKTSDGAFEVRGHKDPGGLEMVAYRGTQASARVARARGTRDVEILLPRSVDVTGTVRPFAGSGVQLRLESVSDPRTPPSVASVWSPEGQDDEAKFRFSGVRFGTYRLVGRLLGDHADRVRIDEVVVGDTTPDPRLQGVTLGTTHVVELTFERADGQSLEHPVFGSVFVREAGSGSDWLGLSMFPKGASYSVWFSSAFPRVEVRVVPADFDAVELQDVSDRATVVLREPPPSPQLRLQFAESVLDAETSDVWIRVRRQRTAGSARFRYFGGGETSPHGGPYWIPMDTNEVTEIDVPTAGEYELEFGRGWQGNRPLPFELAPKRVRVSFSDSSVVILRRS